MFSCSLRHIYEMVKIGELRSVRFGGRICIPRSAVEEVLGEPIGDRESAAS